MSVQNAPPSNKLETKAAEALWQKFYLQRERKKWFQHDALISAIVGGAVAYSMVKAPLCTGLGLFQAAFCRRVSIGRISAKDLQETIQKTLETVTARCERKEPCCDVSAYEREVNEGLSCARLRRMQDSVLAIYICVTLPLLYFNSCNSVFDSNLCLNLIFHANAGAYIIGLLGGAAILNSMLDYAAQSLVSEYLRFKTGLKNSALYTEMNSKVGV